MEKIRTKARGPYKPAAAGQMRLGYLSGAPRVSTRPTAEVSGARTHVLGVMHAFEALGWEVLPYIVGDRIGERCSGRGSERALGKSFLHLLAADAVRYGLGIGHSYRAHKEFAGRVDWVYERLAVFQAMGRRFQRQGIPWILETNAPLTYEAKVERRSVALSTLAHSIELSAYRDCDVLICVSKELREILTSCAKVPARKILVIPNGVDTAVYDPARYQSLRLFQGFTVGFVGSLYRWQALDLLLKAVAEIESERGIVLNVVVVGDGAMRSEWELLSRELGLSERVRFVGRVPPDDVPRYIAGFDVAYSGQTALQNHPMYLSPLKLYEYQAMAKPVVASAYSDARQLIQQGETGYLFDPGNRESLKQALIAAYETRDRHEAMGNEARANVVSRHSWIARVRQMVTGIDAILGGES